MNGVKCRNMSHFEAYNFNTDRKIDFEREIISFKVLQ